LFPCLFSYYPPLGGCLIQLAGRQQFGWVLNLIHIRQLA
jgi:hypothetical protein